MIEIDGAMGEGGGQVLRSSLALSILTQTPMRIRRIRAGRERPGLMRQHLTAVLAAQAICCAEVQGAELKSTELEFCPGPVAPGDYHFAIGTAGSTMLVLQTVLPVLMVADRPSSVNVEGGTHNPGAPTADFLTEAWLPRMRAMGAKVDLKVIRRGFFPSGGGLVRAVIEPALEFKPLDWLERGSPISMEASALVANLSRSIAERELVAMQALLGWQSSAFRVEALTDRGGPGNVMSIALRSEGGTEWLTSIGERGKHAEKLAGELAAEALAYIAGDWPIGEHLADQLILPLAVAGGGSFRTGPLSLHAKTNAAVVERFLPVRVHCHEEPGGGVLVQIRPTVR